MGILSSRLVVSDPAAFASPVTEGSDVGGGCKGFDYVIVGGGTAGCVLASRLSEDPNVTVLLVEVGKSHEDVLMSRMPLGFTKLIKSEYDWAFETTPQAKLDGRRVAWARGRMLGGSSATNALIFHHCAPEDFDAWEKQGATGYLKKVESFITHPGSNIEKALHGDSGPVQTRVSPLTPVSNVILDTAVNLGVSRTNDFNTENGTLGVGPFVGTIDSKSERSSAAAAYLGRDVLKRPNLTVAVSTTTEKILFTTDGDGAARATGVQVASSKGRRKYQVRANKEVIVCAGAVGSPHLLMVSGIGPAAHLTEKGVPVVCDSPAVGTNLLDHLSAGAMIMRAKPGTTLDYLYSPASAAWPVLQWLMLGSGTMSSLISQIGLFIRSDDERLPFTSVGGAVLPSADHTSGPKAPDVEVVTCPMAVIDCGTVIPPAGGITIGPILLKPESSGTVRLQSASIWDRPLIDPNYLASESDRNILLKSMRLLIRLARTEPLSSSLILRDSPSNSDFDPYWPSDVNPDTVSDEDLETWMRKHAQTAWHPTSTVRMGPVPGESAVDLQLRVHGVKGLRVVDASVFPDQVSGHTCAVVYALAERAADLIKEASLQTTNST
ncbi:uncharacterized protein FIBRA_05574 [Fibroporia radiculosa]|uniref:Glucose-methanol-choline oxidoreductase N-terminal domain-containing protein n=1 Tax=Fibroporia radiculosa TaxID=599839 RepID=J4IAS9_9APHY|nr:uncharacterized protein FIBRA_05574 [Fibroporia radiculosa]CCM03441.1 predicted protein [Fibroporia radiculosa]